MTSSLTPPIKPHSMAQSPKSGVVSKRRKLLIQLLALMALAVILSLRPRIEAWVQRSETTQSQPAATSDSADSQPGSQPEEAQDFAQSPLATGDNSVTAVTAGQEPGDSSDPNDLASVEDQEQKTTDSVQANPEQDSDGQPEDKDGAGRSRTPETSGKKSGGKGSIVPMKRDPAPKRTAGEPRGEKTDGNLPQTPEWGKLREIRENVFESTAGLIYRSGSADGHRLKHVMKHATDDPSKPVHGVFIGDGDRDVVLALIDEAFDKSKKGGKDVRTDEEGARTVFTVNMKRRVGFTGGQEGKRRNNPECRFIRIVVEREREVISAYPTNR
ncbi:MAG: hypothetical protein ACK58L_15130 [Planctomycetota bacterium]